jgi:hypothetical protein
MGSESKVDAAPALLDGLPGNLIPADATRRRQSGHPLSPRHGWGRPQAVMISANLLRWGQPAAPRAARPLRAGPISLLYEDGDLKNLSLGGVEIIRRIYGAVRDRHWGTVPGTISAEILDVDDDAFRIRYTREHRDGAIHFVWQAEIVGAPDGRLRFHFDGQAKSTFLRNRIGLCVLHPMQTCVDAACLAHDLDGSTRHLRFSNLVVAEQPIPGFQDLAGLDHEVTAGVWCCLRFSGETFETEDQRNWTDASFKTYGTPNRIPIPVEIAEGTQVQQSIELRLATNSSTTKAPRFVPAAVPMDPKPTRVRVDLAGPPLRKLPPLGLAAAPHGRPLSTPESSRLARLALAHLRAEVHFGDPSWSDRLNLVTRDAAELGLPLELVLRWPADFPPDLVPLTRALAAARADVVRVLPLQEGHRTTPAAILAETRRALSEWGVPIGIGTDGDLFQLSREHPSEQPDFIAWSMNPQVHAFDWRSLAETPEASAVQVKSVATIFPGLPTVVSPITFRPRPRSGPLTSATGTQAPDIDPRQKTLFGSAWTLAMLGALLPSTVESLTWFETSGPRGVVESDEASAGDVPFGLPSGSVYPMYHVFADLAEFVFGDVLGFHSDDPRKVAGFALRAGGWEGLWLANPTDQPQVVEIQGLQGDTAWQCRRLDVSNAYSAMAQPEAYRGTPGDILSVNQETCPLVLPECGWVRLLRKAP